MSKQFLVLVLAGFFSTGSFTTNAQELEFKEEDKVFIFTENTDKAVQVVEPKCFNRALPCLVQINSCRPDLSKGHRGVHYYRHGSAMAYHFFSYSLKTQKVCLVLTGKLVQFPTNEYRHASTFIKRDDLPKETLPEIERTRISSGSHANCENQRNEIEERYPKCSD